MIWKRRLSDCLWLKVWGTSIDADFFNVLNHYYMDSDSFVQRVLVVLSVGCLFQILIPDDGLSFV